MAVYKPSNCVPFMNALDLTRPQDLSCEINTSNTKISGYKIRVLDNQGKVIFEGKEYTYLNDPTLIKYGYNNSGYNATTLTVPFVVTDPVRQNENTILFSGYEWNNYVSLGGKPTKKEAADNYNYYTGYFEVNYQTLTPKEYNQLEVIYTRDVERISLIEKPNYQDAIWNEIYYFVDDNIENRIFIGNITETEYNSLTVDKLGSCKFTYVEVKSALSFSEAVEEAKYFFKNPYVNPVIARQLITSQPCDYANLKANDIWTHNNGLYYKKDGTAIENFYNGYLEQPYRWQITLCQGDYGTIPSVSSKWYDMEITNGKVLGSTPNRIQGKPSEEIYKDYYVQLCKKTYDVQSDDGRTAAASAFVGNRVLIKSYDSNYGHIYPAEGFFTQENINAAEYFQIYEYSNNPQYLTAYDQVDYATTIDIDKVIINGVGIVQNDTTATFQPSTSSNSLFTQIYDGEIDSSALYVRLYDTGINQDNKQVIAFKTTSLLLKAQENQAYNGVFLLSSIVYDKSTKRTTITWQRRADADTWANFLNKAFLVLYGSSSGMNYTNTATPLGEINGTNLVFNVEQPIAIYPNETTDEKKYFGEVLKNKTNITYIRPYIGIEAGMKFQYISSNDASGSSSFRINDIDTNLWAIEHDALDVALVPDTKYFIYSYFKSNDESPFYAYNFPQGKIVVENAKGLMSKSNTIVVKNRQIIVNAIYEQEQNISWKSFSWELYNDTEGYVVEQSDTLYSGSFRHIFNGVENGSYYTLKFTVENNFGVNMSDEITILIQVDEIEKVEDFIGEFNCALQSVDFSFVQDAKVIPTPSDSSYVSYGEGVDSDPETCYMVIDEFVKNRDYGLTYETALTLNNAEIPINVPEDNSFTLNSEHILGSWFEGVVIDVPIDTKPFNDNKARRRLIINAGQDTSIATDDRKVTNTGRNKMNAYLYYELYDGEEWIVDSTRTAITPVKFYGDIPEGSDGSIWRDTKTIVFANCEDGKQNKEVELYPLNYDYLETSTVYGTEVSSGETVGSEASNYILSKYLYNKFDGNPYSMGQKNGNGLGVWLDNVSRVYTQNNGNFALYDTAIAAKWPKDDEDDFVWYDNVENGLVRQVDINSTINRSGRQEFVAKKLTFNIVASNIDPVISGQKVELIANCFIENFTKTYNINADALSSYGPIQSNPTKITIGPYKDDNGNNENTNYVTLKFEAKDGIILPSTISISNAAYAWNVEGMTATLVIANAIGDVVVEVEQPSERTVWQVEDVVYINSTPMEGKQVDASGILEID